MNRVDYKIEAPLFPAFCCFLYRKRRDRILTRFISLKSTTKPLFPDFFYLHFKEEVAGHHQVALRGLIAHFAGQALDERAVEGVRHRYFHLAVACSDRIPVGEARRLPTAGCIDADCMK